MNGFKKQRAILSVRCGNIAQESYQILTLLVSTQQCIEKYMKALLQKYNVRFEKIHDLLALKELCLSFCPELELHAESLAYLNQFAIAFRYPGESAKREHARRAVKVMKQLRSILRGDLGIVDE